MNNKFWIAFVAAVIVAISAFFYLSTHRGAQEITPTAEQETPTTQNAILKQYSFHAKTSGTVLEAMRDYAKSAQFDFTTKEFKGLGIMIEAINGQKSDNGYYWLLYINGKSSDKGASEARVSPGDTIEWKLEKGY